MEASEDCRTCGDVPKTVICTLTYQLSLLRGEKHVDIVRVNNRREILVAVGDGGAPRLELPSIDLERSRIRVGGNGSDFPGDVATVRFWVGPEPVERASVISTLRIWRLESKTKSDGWPRGLTTKNSANNAYVEVICRPTRGQTKQTRGLIAI